MILNGIKYYYVRDITGTIIGLLDEEGILVEEYQYDAYGVVLSTNTLYNPFLYKGYYYDKETSMYYCKSRYYAPELCRFISLDDIEYLDPESVNGLNLYCYCMNNPIMYCDPSGHFAVSALTVTLSVLLATMISAAVVAVNDDNINFFGALQMVFWTRIEFF